MGTAHQPASGTAGTGAQVCRPEGLPGSAPLSLPAWFVPGPPSSAPSLKFQLPMWAPAREPSLPSGWLCSRYTPRRFATAGGLLAQVQRGTGGRSVPSSSLLWPAPYLVVPISDQFIRVTAMRTLEVPAETRQLALSPCLPSSDATRQVASLTARWELA